MEGCAHEALAALRDAIAPRARDLRHQAVRPQQADPATDAPTLPTSLRRVARPGAEQPLRQLTIAEAADGVLAAQRGRKQGLIVAPQRLQGAPLPPLIRDRRAASIQFPLADAEVVDDRQRLQ